MAVRASGAQHEPSTADVNMRKRPFSVLQDHMLVKQKLLELPHAALFTSACRAQASNSLSCSDPSSRQPGISALAQRAACDGSRAGEAILAQVAHADSDRVVAKAPEVVLIVARAGLYQLQTALRPDLSLATLCLTAHHGTAPAQGSVVCNHVAHLSTACLRRGHRPFLALSRKSKRKECGTYDATSCWPLKL
eukprot:CAMPEP_0179097654 /NCGR_PEP_ID=MMETSP0796-20121207/44957_1 /TAXON_ID=73915 /ORGANISM="Pyrodinium bahamense, Strain pbaha01" /LENGTH=192 /DNA_ID=CAMNT_0020795403 /DNA_START=24 /DNA_END=599 /DNA_ORIENTATION=+